MECAYYFASWNGIAFNSQPQAYFPVSHIGNSYFANASPRNLRRDKVLGSLGSPKPSLI